MGEIDHTGIFISPHQLFWLLAAELCKTKACDKKLMAFNPGRTTQTKDKDLSRFYHSPTGEQKPVLSPPFLLIALSLFLFS